MEHVDQLGNVISLSAFPRRIVSLVPSQTELLFDLGLDSEIVGITKYCISPKDKVANVAKVGGTKHFNFQAIDNLSPDLIIGNKEENYPDGIYQLREKYPVWVSEIITIDDALQMIKSVGELVNRSKKARLLVDEINIGFDSLKFSQSLKVAYLIWKNPYMVAAGETFINEMLRRCGFINIFESKKGYPQIVLDELGTADVILLSTEPYHFDGADIENIAGKWPVCRVRLVDGEMFSWYGSRMKFAAEYFRKLQAELNQG